MTLDMTNNRVPYGLLTDEEKAALHEHEKAGGGFEYFGFGGSWHPISTWRIEGIARTVPLPKTQDVIAWDRLPDWAEWVARDDVGAVRAYNYMPKLSKLGWGAAHKMCRIDDFPGIVQIGTCDWKESKMRRPRE